LMLLAGSGAAKGDVNQLVGMRGVFADVNNRVIPFLVAHNLREGMTPLEYFVSTRGARKGLIDTALKTADGGYLTRRFADALQDVVARVADCGATDGLTVAGRIRRIASARPSRPPSWAAASPPPRATWPDTLSSASACSSARRRRRIWPRACSRERWPR